MTENTIQAMLRAIDLGVTTLEMDVVITKDRKVVLSHDHYMNPEYVSPPQGIAFSSNEDKSFRIYEMDFEAVSQWDVGSKGNPKFPEQKKIASFKPLLSVLIDSVEAYTRSRKLKPVRYNIETKMMPNTDNKFHPGPDEFVALVMEVVEAAGIAKRTTIQSFDKRSLQVIHQQYPMIKTSFLIGAGVKNNLTGIIDELGFLPDIISPELRLVNPEFLKECKEKKIMVVVWTVNDADTIKKMADMGVDGIISDYPDRFSVLKK